jgi:hypothetical protein
MKLPKSFNKVLENKYVLYFVLFLSVTNILGYLFLGNLNAVIFFILVGYLVYNFSKNMIIVLTIPLVLTSILMIGRTVKEGMEGAKVDEAKQKMADAKQTLATNHPEQAATVATAQTNLAAKKEDVKNKIKTTIGESQPMTGTDAETEPTTTTDTTTTETTTEMAGFQSDGSNKRRNRIDYAATVEDAYGDLNKILGGDGIKRLTEDTQQLMNQQVQLADAMKNMGPLLEQAKGMLQGFDFKQLGGIADIAKNFTGQQ